MERTRTGYRVLQWIVFGVVVLGVAAGYGRQSASARGGGAQPQHPLPAPRQREEGNLLTTLKHLLLDSVQNPDADHSVLLARVVRVDRYPAEVYARYEESRRYNPDLDLDLLVGVRGDRFQTLKTLSGRPAPLWLEVDNRGESDWHTFATSRMRLGEYWIVVYDHKTRTVRQEVRHGTTWLTGPDDPLLSIYRRHVKWLARQDRERVFAEMRAVLLDPNLSVASRMSAFLSMRAYLTQGLAFESPDYPFMRHAIVELLAQPEVPRELKLIALRSIHVDTTREIAPGSEEALLLHYLLDLVKTGTDREIINTAADMIASIARQSSSVSGKYTVYYIPGIMSVLESREVDDRARDPRGYSPVSGALNSLRRGLELDKGHPVVIRRLPASLQE